MRLKPKYASLDAAKGPWTTCSTCGFIWSASKLAFQYDYDGSSAPRNQGWLRCPKCIDDLNFQKKLLVIPPDPRPFYNTRPEPYRVDETNWLYDFDGNRVIDQNADPITVDIPNSLDPGMICEMTALLRQPGGSVAVAYLDLFNGNPAGAGHTYYSVLQQLTGSATRTNIAAQLSPLTASSYNNPSPITITASLTVDTVNVTHAAFFDAPTGGTRLMSGTVTSSPPPQKNFAVRFNSGAVVVLLS